MSEYVNIYDTPERFGLVNVGTMDLDDQPWQFNMLLVQFHPETNKFYVSQDSGCSCPSPFEDITTLDGIKPMTEIEAKSYISKIAISKSTSFFKPNPHEVIQGIVDIENKRGKVTI